MTKNPKAGGHHAKSPLRTRVKRRLGALGLDRSGMALVEFAMVAPVVLSMGVVGTELSYLAVTNMRISQAAMHIADNASRIGDREMLSSQRIYESDINDLLAGVNFQAGEAIDLFEHGRVIISSLEQNADGGQWIHWQRCLGKKVVSSAYGPEGTGATGTGFAGMGTTGEELTAAPGQAVMFVEITYDYQPLIDNGLVQEVVPRRTITSTAAFNVRGSRDLAGIYPKSPSPVRDCNTYGTL